MNTNNQWEVLASYIRSYPGMGYSHVVSTNRGVSFLIKNERDVTRNFDIRLTSKYRGCLILINGEEVGYLDEEGEALVPGILQGVNSVSIKEPN